MGAGPSCASESHRRPRSLQQTTNGRSLIRPSNMAEIRAALISAVRLTTPKTVRCQINRHSTALSSQTKAFTTTYITLYNSCMSQVKYAPVRGVVQDTSSDSKGNILRDILTQGKSYRASQHNMQVGNM